MVRIAREISRPNRGPRSKRFCHIERDDAVSVRTFEPVSVSHQRRLEIADELRKYAEVGAAGTVSEEEAEDILTEGMEVFAQAIVLIGVHRPGHCNPRARTG
jgi:hypothetical protein